MNHLSVGYSQSMKKEDYYEQIKKKMSTISLVSNKRHSIPDPDLEGNLPKELKKRNAIGFEY